MMPPLLENWVGTSGPANTIDGDMNNIVESSGTMILKVLLVILSQS